ncbi:MAG: hypothetical protein ACXU9I_01395 [Syntrophales bacterium]
MTINDVHIFMLQCRSKAKQCAWQKGERIIHIFLIERHIVVALKRIAELAGNTDFPRSLRIDPQRGVEESCLGPLIYSKY